MIFKGLIFLLLLVQFSCLNSRDKNEETSSSEEFSKAVDETYIRMTGGKSDSAFLQVVEMKLEEMKRDSGYVKKGATDKVEDTSESEDEEAEKGTSESEEEKTEESNKSNEKSMSYLPVDEITVIPCDLEIPKGKEKSIAINKAKVDVFTGNFPERGHHKTSYTSTEQDGGNCSTLSNWCLENDHAMAYNLDSLRTVVTPSLEYLSNSSNKSAVKFFCNYEMRTNGLFFVYELKLTRLFERRDANDPVIKCAKVKNPIFTGFMCE